MGRFRRSVPCNTRNQRGFICLRSWDRRAGSTPGGRRTHGRCEWSGSLRRSCDEALTPLRIRLQSRPLLQTDAVDAEHTRDRCAAGTVALCAIAWNWARSHIAHTSLRPQVLASNDGQFQACDQSPAFCARSGSAGSRHRSELVEAMAGRSAAQPSVRTR
jgi:hypothetical protein